MKKIFALGLMIISLIGCNNNPDVVTKDSGIKV